MTGSIIVTGASLGIGAALARCFLREGRSVFGIDRMAPDPDLSGIPGYAHFIADVTDEPAMVAAFDSAWAGGQVAAVFANAAVTDIEHRRATEIAYESWRHVLRVNVDGAFLTGRLAARRMLAELRGNIVFITSSLARLGGALPGDAPYCTSKAAVEMFSKVLSLELAGTGVNVNSLFPSVKVDTGFFAHLGEAERTTLARPDILNTAARFLAGLPPGTWTGLSIDQQRFDEDDAYRRSLTQVLPGENQ